MIKPFLQNDQVGRLNSIIEEANKTFLKESRLSNNINFNILRVLSAFRLMYPQSPTSLYNAIIYITKNYNPTSFNQWKAAINELSKLKKHVQKQKHNVSRPQIPSYMKTYQNSFNKQRMQDGHFQSKSFAQIKIPADLSLSDESSSFYDIENKDISQTNAETGKRQYYTKTDTSQYPEKNHYISFQPYHQISGIYPHSYFQKENVNSTNIGESRKKDSSYQYIEAIRRDLAKTNKNSFVKSPIDQSFIKNIDSYQSPYLLSQPDLLPIDPEEQKMNERAYGFLRFNLLFKSFSSILANSLVLQKAKEHRLKAETQKRSNVLQKSFEALRNNQEKQKMQRQKQKIADIHYSKNMKSKVISIFKLIFDLRNKQTPLNIQLFNRLSYEFILTMLLSTQKTEQTTKFDWIDFNLKIDQLIQNNQIDKVCLIVKYFGNHTWINKQTFQNLIESYRLSICKLAFKALKSEQSSNAKYQIHNNLRLAGKAYSILKSRWMKIKSYNTKILQAKGRRNQALQQKVMKVLLQIMYSTKLYSKRCEYLQKKTETSLRIKILQQWIQKTKQKGKKKQLLKENIKISQMYLNRFYQAYAFRTMQQDNINLVDKIDKLQSIILASTSTKFIRLLKNGHRNTKQNIFMQQSTKKMMYRLALLKWKSRTRKGKGIGIVFAVIKKYYFRSLMSPVFKDCIEIMNEIKEAQMNSIKLFFRHWKNWCDYQAKKYELLADDFSSKINFLKRMRAINMLQKNHQYELQARKKQQRRIKSQKVLSFLQNNSKKETFFTFISQIERKIQYKIHTSQLNRNIYKNKTGKLFLRIQSQKQKNMKIRTLNRLVFDSFSHRMMEGINIQLLNFKKKKVNQMRKKDKLRHIGDIALLYKKQNQKKQKKADKYLTHRYLSKAIVSLFELIRQRDEVQALVKQNTQNKQLELLKQLIIGLRNHNKLKKIKNKLDQKHLFKILKQNKDNSLKYRQLYLRNLDLACKQVFLKLRAKNISKNSSGQHQQKMKMVQKWIFIHRLQTYFVNSLIYKKYLFMSVKYRAIKICSTAFNTWKNSKFPQKIAVRRNERVSKGKERLSTDVMD